MTKLPQRYRDIATVRFEKTDFLAGAGVLCRALETDAHAMTDQRSWPGEDQPVVEASDLELVERTLGGENHAFEMLVRRWERPIFSLAYRLVGSDEDARDVCQETFLAAFRHLKSFRGEAKFSSWLYRIALNACHSRQRRQPAEQLSLEEQAEARGFDPLDASASVDERLLHDERAQLVRRALAALPPEMRQVIVMKEYEGLKFHEIADVLGLPVSTVKTRLYTGLNILRRRLEGLGLARPSR
ncbi:sigma-70 family RNA polymerase sigma factor [Chloracidobacterium validum]|uniref:Sigma-70 family RNA polymerase sigma factor n=1 Tax=Chloracidobacterium validum TaxID=2821543 RepID=A0ABX8B9L3_9BACT|nr:sigma-70 family RNA polymerase sigma factor [Chloracidobacterium validum]QUW03107.1 sigma-70 family RNA polymerase sigma factor [Chloracidobacterium validum]